MGLNLVMYAILTFVSMNYIYHTTLVSTNKVIITIEENEKENIRNIRSAMYTLADSLAKDSENPRPSGRG